MKQIKFYYVSVSQVLFIHQRLVKQYKGTLGIRDFNSLVSAVKEPHSNIKGQDTYRNVFEKASALIKSILQNHPFLDENRRTALTVASFFLRINGYKLQTNQEEEVDFTISVDTKNLSIDKISKWLKNRS